MKIACSLFSSILLAVAVGACASAPDDTGEALDVGRVSQAICKSGAACLDDPGGDTVQDSPPPVLCKGALCPGEPGGGDSVAVPPPPEAWVCPRVQVACGPVLVAVESEETGEIIYECREGCPGGGFPTQIYNPCPFWYPRYVCSPLGKCQCI